MTHYFENPYADGPPARDLRDAEKNGKVYWRPQPDHSNDMDKEMPKNNDGRSSCAWCGAPTRNYGGVGGLPPVGQICTKCGK